MQETGTFRGVVQEHAVGLSTNQCPQLVIKLQAVEKYNFEAQDWVDYAGREDCEITAFLTLFKADATPIFHVEAVKKVFSWDGASLAVLDSMDLNGAALQFNVEEHTYNDETRLQVSKIDEYDATPSTGVVRKLDAQSLKDLDAKFGNALQKLSGGPKVASAPGAPTTTPVKTQQKASPKPPSRKATAPPAPPSSTKPTKELKYTTKDEAWEACYKMKAKTITDEVLGKAFLAAQNKIAKNKDEDNITADEWNSIADLVLAEYGVF